MVHDGRTALPMPAFPILRPEATEGDSAEGFLRLARVGQKRLRQAAKPRLSAALLPNQFVQPKGSELACPT